MIAADRAVDVRCVVDAGAQVGEGALWSPSDQALWWVDILACEVHRYDPARGDDRVWTLPSMVGCVGLRATGGLVLALADGFALFDPDSGALRMAGDYVPSETGARFNDGVVTPQGHLLATTMQAAGTTDDPVQTVRVLHPDHHVSVLTGGLRALVTASPSPTTGVRCIYRTRTPPPTGSGRSTGTAAQVLSLIADCSLIPQAWSAAPTGRRSMLTAATGMQASAAGS